MAIKCAAVIKTASDINSFIQNQMCPLGAKPGKASVAIMLWRLSKTSIGEEMLRNYCRAIKNPDLWRETTAIILQNLSGLMRAVKLCSDNRDYDNINNSLNEADKTRLKDIVNEAACTCRARGYSADDLFGYIEDCRNIYIHSGIMPYIIDSASGRMGLNNFLRHKFEDNPTVLIATSIGATPFNSKGETLKFKSLCNLILSALAFYFDSLKPNLSKFTPIRIAGLYLSMTFYTIVTVFKYIAGGIIMAVVSAFYLLRLSLIACIVLVVVAIILLVCSKTVEFVSGSSRSYALTEIEPAELTEWVGEMSPFEQMLFIKDRKSALSACNIKHAIGDEVFCSADSVTEVLYTKFKDYPDPSAHPFSYILPNPGHLARFTVYSWLLNKQYGEKLFSTSKPSIDRQEIAWLPIYEGDCYPVLEIYNNLPLEKLKNIGENILKHEKLNVVILSASHATNSRNNSDSAELAKKVRQTLIKVGVRSRNIRIVPDMTRSSGVTLAIGGISNYTERRE